MVVEIWNLLNGPNNQPIIVALIIGWIALLISHFKTLWSYRSRLRDKDKEIEGLVTERNKLQDFILQEIGSKRLTTKSPSNRREGK
jgi:hypothetical protein